MFSCSGRKHNSRPIPSSFNAFTVGLADAVILPTLLPWLLLGVATTERCSHEGRYLTNIGRVKKHKHAAAPLWRQDKREEERDSQRGREMIDRYRQRDENLRQRAETCASTLLLHRELSIANAPSRHVTNATYSTRPRLAFVILPTFISILEKGSPSASPPPAPPLPPPLATATAAGFAAF